MPTLYLRVSDQAKNYVAGVARLAGISESKAAEALLLKAESECWTIERMTATVRPASETDSE